MTSTHLRALGTATDLAVLAASGSEFAWDTSGSPAALIVRTPALPAFHWGNFVLATEGWPVPATDWVARFDQAFPSAAHCAIGVDAPEAPPADVVAQWLALGGEVTSDIVLTAAPLAVRPTRGALPLRQLRDDEFAQLPAIELDDLGTAAPTGHAAFLDLRAAQRAALVESGSAAWFGAFDGELLVSALGIVDTPHGARFQDVGTRAAYRRRGLAGALVARAARFAAEYFGAERAVIVAEDGGEALRLYERLGFERCERHSTFSVPRAS